MVQFPAGIRDLSRLQHVQTGSGTTQHHIQLHRWAPCWGIKRSGYKADHSPLSGANIKNVPSPTSTPPYSFTACAGSISLFNLRGAMPVHNCFTGYNVSYSTRLRVSTYSRCSHARARARAHTRTHCRLFQITNIMHNSFIFQQYVCYTTLLNMFRAARCSSSGGQTVSPQPLVSSPSVNSRTVCRWRADSALHLHTARLITKGDDTRGCGDTICPPEDEQRALRNMLRSVV